MFGFPFVAREVRREERHVWRNADGREKALPGRSTVFRAEGKKLLLLSVSAGAGHTRAAEALRAYAADHPHCAEALHLDVMDYVPRAFRYLYVDLYIALVNHYPGLWGQLYRITDEAHPRSLMQRLRRAAERINSRALLRQIGEYAPDAIICTHFLPAEILAGMVREQRLSCPVWVQVTDFDLHRMWVQEGMAGYFAGSEEVAFRMRAQGIPERGIHVTGIPIVPAFAAALDRTVCAREFGLDPQRRTVLLTGGGAGLGSLHDVAAHLLRIEEDFQLVVLAGRNADALAALQRLADTYKGRLFPQGFTNKIERLMACADLVVTKPGGLTSSECLAMGLPMVLNAPIPGQEERNADFLLEQGSALKASDKVTLEYRVRHLLAHPDLLAAMRARAASLGRPRAAQQILDIVFANSTA